MVKLLPCPFCGETDLRAVKLHRSNYDYWTVGCSNPECVVNPETNGETKKGVIAQWNTRTQK